MLARSFVLNLPTHGPEILATRNTSYLTTSKSLNGRKIARMARNWTIFGPNESSRRDLFLEKFSKERNTRKVFEKFENFSKKLSTKIFVQFSVARISETSLGTRRMNQGTLLRSQRLSEIKWQPHRQAHLIKLHNLEPEHCWQKVAKQRHRSTKQIRKQIRII